MNGGRSQSLHGTAVAVGATGAGSKTAPRDGRQEGGGGKSITMQGRGPKVLATTKHGPDAAYTIGAGAEALMWTKRMLSALGNGVKGGNLQRLFFADTRLFTIYTARHFARQSR